MTSIARDDNFVPIQSNEAIIIKKTVTFDGGTENDLGDADGTGNPATLFTVTGDVIVSIISICKTTLVGDTATLEVGVTDATALLIAQTTATDIDIKETWTGSTPVLVGDLLPDGSAAKIIGSSQDIIQTVGTADITAGVLDYYCLYRPLESDATVVAA